MSSINDYFISQGWSVEQAAGITGNLIGESNLNPAAIGDGGNAYGIAQWHPDRQANFQQQFGFPIQGSSVMQQAQFVNWELNNTEKKAGALLRAQNTIEGATKAFMTGFERPANLSSLGKRISAALASLNGDTAKLGARAVLAGVTGGASEIALGAAKAVGIGGKSWLEQIKDWLKESHFWQRLGIGFLALIFIAGALYLLGTGKLAKIVKET